MFAGLFDSKPVLDQGSSEWILDTFAWALEHFELNVFKADTQLILPTNDFYPGKVSSISEMAQSVFDKTLVYAGMQHWPVQLVQPQHYQQHNLPRLSFAGAVRGQGSTPVIAGDIAGQEKILISYNPNQINQPQDLVASYAQSLAAVLILQQGHLPPGGQEFMPQAVDLVACFMGFGVMLANTAYQFKGGCGSCYNASANRQAALPEQDTLYMLALFSILKSISVKSVTPHLKSHMKSTFKSAYKEVMQLMRHSPYPALQAVRQ